MLFYNCIYVSFVFSKSAIPLYLDQCSLSSYNNSNCNILFKVKIIARQQEGKEIHRFSSILQGYIKVKTKTWKS